jgi:hypothetical protein
MRELSAALLRHQQDLFISDNQFKIVVNADGDNAYIEGEPGTEANVLEQFEQMKGGIMHVDGKEVFIFDGKDDLLILNGDNQVVKVWNRDEPRDIADYASFSLEHGGKRKVLGYQIVDVNGYNIHGEENDLWGMASFQVLQGEAVEQARAWADENPGFKVVEVYAGDIEEPSIVSTLPNLASAKFGR